MEEGKIVKPVFSSRLDYRHVPREVDMSTTEQEFMTHVPVSPLDTNGSIVVDLPALDFQFYDLKDLSLFVRLKVVKQDGTALPDTVNVFPCNNFLYNLFRNVSIYMNDKLTYTSDSQYSYRAMIENLITKQEPDKNIGFYKETTNGEPTNAEIQGRGTMLNGSRIIEMEGPIISDIATIDRLIPNKVNIRIVFERNSPLFTLMKMETPPAGSTATTEVKISILDFHVRVRKVALHPQVFTTISNVIDNHTSYFPMLKAQIKTIGLSSGSYGTTVERLFSGQVPKIVIVGLVSQAAYQGQYTSTPFNFQHAFVSKICVSSDDHAHPGNYLQFDFEGQKTLEGYSALKSIIGNEREIILNRDSFINGKTLFGFELAPTLDPNCEPRPRTGNCKLELTLAKSLTENMVIIVYGLFDTKLWMKSTREFYYE